MRGFSEMRAQHDLGGLDEGAIDTHEHEVSLYERRADAILVLLAKQGCFTVDAQRRVWEDLPPDVYRDTRYYDSWLLHSKILLIERGLIDESELQARIEEVAVRLRAERAGGADLADHHVHDDGGEHAAIEHNEAGLSDFEILEEAMRELCIEKGLFTAAEVQREVQDLESSTPSASARLIAQSWVEAEFRSALLANAYTVASNAGIDMTGSPPVQAVENTPELHHVVACTLCSCYPRALLGRPPAWYKSRAYRARIVVDPRGVLREFGTELPDATQIKVVDSTADLRYLVVPMRPAGTEGWAIDKLAELVTRDSMIGVAPARTPTNS